MIKIKKIKKKKKRGVAPWPPWGWPATPILAKEVAQPPHKGWPMGGSATP
jgi:hypothetical protein